MRIWSFLYTVHLANCSREWRGGPYPTSIETQEVRKDANGLPVTRGRLHLVGENVVTLGKDRKVHKRFSYADYKRRLQCATSEPDLDYHGAISLMILSPPTKDSIEVICAWIESGCADHNITESTAISIEKEASRFSMCRNNIRRYKKGEYVDAGMDAVIRGKNEVNINHFSLPIVLHRIINGRLYYDWPWGIERFKKTEHVKDKLKLQHVLDDSIGGDHEKRLALINTTLTRIHDLGDSFFFTGGELASIPMTFPVPMLSFSASLQKIDIAFPWHESISSEWDLYKTALHGMKTDKASFSDDILYSTGEKTLLNRPEPWSKREPRAAFFATLLRSRQMVWDQAIRRPDLFFTRFSFPYPIIHSWNPSSKLDEVELNTTEVNNPSPLYDNNSHPGEPKFILPLMSSGGMSYNPKKFKYIIVPSGHENQATSGRLSSLLAHSGAVILLQRHQHTHHFSSRLQPWVHYVPLTMNMADATEKIEWLREHDDMAQQIAVNAKNFGKSYLRMEDYFCYTATFLKTFSEIAQNSSDALTPFQAIAIPSA